MSRRTVARREMLAEIGALLRPAGWVDAAEACRLTGVTLGQLVGMIDAEVVRSVEVCPPWGHLAAGEVPVALHLVWLADVRDAPGVTS